VEDEERNLFYWACNALKLDIARYLIELGVNPNRATRMGRTALSKGAWNGSIEVVKLILDLKDVDIDK